MDGPDDRRLHEIEARLHHDDPRFAHGLRQGRPYQPREYRYGRAWLLLAVALAALGTGIALAHGLLLAAGLVLAGIAGEMFDPQRRMRNRRDPPPPEG